MAICDFLKMPPSRLGEITTIDEVFITSALIGRAERQEEAQRQAEGKSRRPEPEGVECG